ncbi:IS30 family transposase [Prauserella muralis]|uniref:Integrase n=1 Tax=Prauserella muralis TaxID=588067 RepID=A0A2V4AP98_9PSEU|nr:IS30 family transposase [Prauserella muralis]PXY21459.1 integrase [Prauserella muralis]
MARRVIPVEVRERFFVLVCAGWSLGAAARAVGVASSTAGRWWRSSGLVETVMEVGRRGGLAGSPPPVVSGGADAGGGRRRRLLTGEDRCQIAVGLRCGLSYAEIGAMLGRDRSVVWREVQRNRGRDGSYVAPVAHRAAFERRRRPKRFKLQDNPGLCRQIEEWMDQGWSPRLIAMVLAEDHPVGSRDRVCHETIYQALYVQARGRLRADLHTQLSLKRRRRKPRTTPRAGSARLYAEAFTISQRPAEVADRAVPGHWEGDLILGAGNRSAIGTLIERTTRFTLLLHLPQRHDAATVAAAMIREMQHLPEHLRRSLTWDRGRELACYSDIQLALNMPVYFCDPHSPWQRGSNENTNRLLRFWFHRGTNLATHTRNDLHRIAATLNNRPRPTLNLQTPAQALDRLLANPAAAPPRC